MRRTLTGVVALAAALALGSPVIAAQASGKASTKAHTASAKSMAATGKIAKYDASSKTLTLTTSKGDESFVLGSDAKVMHGGKAVSDLNTLVGHSARVHYTDQGGAKTATSVSVSGMASASKAKAKSEKTSG